jgi:hypothetical protein
MGPSEKIPDTQWQQFETIIRQLYTVENLKLDALMSVMSTQYGFCAT